MRAKEIRTRARESLSGTWGLSVGVTLVAALLGGTLIGAPTVNLSVFADALPYLPEEFILILMAVAAVTAIWGIVMFIMGGAVQVGYARFLLKQYGKAPNLAFQDLFSGFNHFGQGFAQRFLASLYILLWSLLFIIPGIVKSFAYAMTPFIMAENPDMTANEAITASKRMMKGHKGQLFWLGLTFIGWNFLCLLSCGIGYLFLVPYMNASYAAFYRYVSREE